LAIVPLALLRRGLRVRTISSTYLITSGLGSLAAVVAAWRGFGVWSLVIQQLLPCVAVFFLSLRWSGYRPGRSGRIQAVLPLLGFGGRTGLANILNYLQANLGLIAVGYFCGATEAGFFSRALLLRNLPTQYTTGSFHDVMIPALVALRDDVTRLGSAYRKSLTAIALCACPLATWLCVSADEVVGLLYGLPWMPSADLLRWLAIAGIAMPLQATTAWLYLASGRAGWMTRQAVINLVLMAVGCLVGAMWGGKGIAVGLTITLVLPIMAVMYSLSHRAVGIRLTDTALAMLPVLTACVVAAFSGVIAGMLAEHAKLTLPVVLASKSICGGIAYLAAIAGFYGRLPAYVTHRWQASRAKEAFQ
jgi:PST family polysaccharide transporter